ncbi:hypothetical protein LCGC14_0413150 [marine sediment metagenome]|uniref:Uncharacterized protein n=1 Tax=marine sediment metagenome TaxID=412755 RepID=A0A0F9W270_9ZZZZ
MSVTKVGDWGKAQAILGASSAKFRKAFDKALLQEAQFFRKKIIQGFTRQAPGGKKFRKLARSTLRSRRFKGFRGRKALIRTAELRNSVTLVKKREGIFVGVLRSARGKDGRKLVDIALLMEKGSRPIVIRITPKMQRFLAAMFGGRRARRLKKKSAGVQGIIIIKIPARPFLAPIFKRFGRPSMVKNRFLARVAKQLKGDYGVALAKTSL